MNNSWNNLASNRAFIEYVSYALYQVFQIYSSIVSSRILNTWLWIRNIIRIINLYMKTYIYLFKVSNRNTRKRCEICSKLTIKTTKQSQEGHSGVFIVNFKHILHFFSSVSIVDLNRQIFAGFLWLWHFQSVNRNVWIKE